MGESRKVGSSAGNRGMGRKKGVPNKFTAEVKDMILQALDKAGGVEYLARQAEENPGPFMTLVGKVLPMQVNANVSTAPAFTIHDLIVPPPAEGQ